MPAPIGNRNAVKENRLWSEAIRRALVQKNGAKLRRLADRLIERAEEGDIAALKEIGDRMDGKPAQAIVGADGGDLVFRLEASWLTPAIAKRNSA